MYPSRAQDFTVDITPREIRSELQRVLGSPEFERCPQLQRFLNFVVEEELAGRGAQLKEYVLAVGVFGRSADFDPRLDSLVRVEARRLRRALEKYYDQESRADSIFNLGVGYTWMGQYEKCAAETKEALSLEPNNVLPYSNLAASYIKLERLQDAQAVLTEAGARNLSSKFLRSNLGYLAFLRNDAATMERQLAEVKDKSGDEDPLLSQQSDTEAYYGRLKRAREFSRRAVDSAARSQAKEAAAGGLVNSALREADFGNASEARMSPCASLRAGM